MLIVIMIGCMVEILVCAPPIKAIFIALSPDFSPYALGCAPARLGFWCSNYCGESYMV